MSLRAAQTVQRVEVVCLPDMVLVFQQHLPVEALREECGVRIDARRVAGAFDLCECGQQRRHENIRRQMLLTGLGFEVEKDRQIKGLSFQMLGQKRDIVREFLLCGSIGKHIAADRKTGVFCTGVIELKVVVIFLLTGGMRDLAAADDRKLLTAFGNGVPVDVLLKL